MAINAPISSCLVIGAGLSGLIAARRLTDASLKATILEKGSTVGGRLATLSLSGSSDQEPGSAAFDYGAQFFTVRDARYKKLVDQWQADGLVVEWSRGFAAGDGSYYADGHPRYRGQPNMAALTTYLADGLNIHLNTEVDSIELDGGLWSVSLPGNLRLTSSILILTPPVPQSLKLLKAPWLAREAAARQLLEKISYDPCLALLILLDGPGDIPPPGGLWPTFGPPGGPIDWIADNYQKGVSSIPGAITIHAAAEFSREYWDADDEVIYSILLAAADPWISGQILMKKVHRWEHSKPAWTYPDPYYVADLEAPLIFAGDAFAGPRVEGAVLSGLAAADWLLNNWQP
jgi:predicted NAD/FAD-dependent oxidoreductase